LDIDDRPPSTDSADSSALETEGPQEAPSRPRFGNRTQLALVFLLATAFSLLSSSVPYFAVALVYGLAAARSLSQADLTFFFWLRSSFAAEIFLVFYVLGRRVDFRGQHLKLAVLSFAGVLVGELLQFVSLQTPSASSSVITGFGLVSVTFGGIIFVLSSAFQLFTVPFAGLALAFLREGHLGAALWPSSATGDRRLLSLPVLITGFTIATMAYLASALIEIIGSSLLQAGQFAFLASNYGFDFFYPLLFFIAFYFLGKRLDSIRGGMIAFSISAFVAGALGFQIGNDLVYVVRVFATPSGQAFSPFSLGLTFFVDSIVQGLYVLALGLAAASLGFVRNIEGPSEHDPSEASPLAGGVAPSPSEAVAAPTAATATAEGLRE
jgi:hypothetical protein